MSQLYKDRTGRVWVGTDRGVSYHQDGVFTPVLTSVPDQEIFAIHVDTRDVLWVGGAKGLHRLRDGVATSWTRDDGLVADRVWSVFMDAEEALWIGAGHGVNVLRGDSLSGIELEGAPWRSRAHHVWRFDQAPDSADLWVQTTGGLFHYREGRLQQFFDVPTEVPRPGSLLAEADGGTLVAAGGRLLRDGRPILESKYDIRTFLYDHEGSIWIATSVDGLHRLKPALFTVYSEPEGLATKIVYPILEDRAGSMWFGARGVSRLRDGVVTSYPTLNGVAAPFVRALFQDRAGTLWVGAWQGLCRFADGVCRPFGEAVGMAEHRVEAIFEDAAGALWVGTTAGLFRYHRGSWSRFTTEDGLSDPYVRSFLETADGALWMATSRGGIARYRGGRFDAFTTAHGLSSNLIRSLYEDPDGVLWVGTEGRGLCRIENHRADDLSEASVTVYRARDGLFDEVIHGILEDQFGRLWMSTNRGIFWVDRARLNAFARGEIDRVTSTSYTERDGLRNREANGGMQAPAVRARDGRLWFATQDGAAVVDPATIRRNEVPPPVVIEQVTVGNRILLPHETVVLAPGERHLDVRYTALSFLAPENVRFRYVLEGFNTGWIEAGDRRTAYFTNVPPGDYTFRVIASNNDAVWNETGAVLALTVVPFFYETGWFLGLCLLLFAALVAGTFRWRTRRLRKREVELAALVAERTKELQEEKATTEAQALRLLELDDARSRFFANVSHEFRTPLTLTIGPLEDMRAGLYGPLPHGASEQISLALRNARRLLRLVNQILDLSKLEASQMELQVRQADLGAFLHHLAPAFTAAAERNRITFVVDVPSAPCPACFDPDQLDKAVANLLSNALKFTPAGGTVRLGLRHEPGDGTGGHALISVRDNGPGIAADRLAHLFERFYQVEKSEMQPGTGIGLALAKELVELHGGTLTVESEVGFGTTFTIRLPAVPALEAAGDPGTILPAGAPESVGESMAPLGLPADDPHDIGEPDASAADRTTVLVVDDHPGIRAYVRRHLEPAFRVVEAADGAAALEAARHAPPDLIVSDVMMPGMDGHALCHALKQDRELDYIPVILLTAKASVENRLEGLGEGADAYLTKPFDVRELVVRVEQLIASRKRLRERFSHEAPRLHARTIDVISSDDAFLERLQSVIEARLDDESFTVEALADALGQSRGHLHRRLRAILNQSPSEAIRTMRLARAAQLLKGQAGLVSEVAYAVGFKSVAHFSTCFREQYGVSPSAYRSGQRAS